MTETVENIAYRESLRAIEQQYQALANLRARAGTVIAGASVVASFLGARALGAGGHQNEIVLSILALLATLGLCGAILWPYPFKFRLSARVILEDHAVGSDPTDIHRLHGYLALMYETHHEQNERIISRLHDALGASIVCLGIETFALLAAVRPV